MSYTSLLAFLFFLAALAQGSGLEEKNGGAASGYYRNGRSQDESDSLPRQSNKWPIGNLPLRYKDGNTLRTGNYFVPPKGETMLENALIENVNRPPGGYQPPFVGSFLEHPLLGRIYESSVTPHLHNPPPTPNVYNPPGSGHIYEPMVVGTMYSPSRPEQIFSPPGHIISPPAIGHMFDSPITGIFQDPSGLGHTSVYTNPAVSHMYDAQWLGSINDPTISEHFYQVPVAAGFIYEPSMIRQIFDSSITGAIYDPPQIIFPGNKLESIMGHPYGQSGYIYPAPHISTAMEPHNSVPLYQASMVGPEVGPMYEPSALGLLAPFPVVKHLLPQSIIKKNYDPPGVGTHPDPIVLESSLTSHFSGKIDKQTQTDSVNAQTGQDQAFTQCQKLPIVPPMSNPQDMGHLAKLVRVLLGTGPGANEAESSDNLVPKGEQCTFTSPTIESGDEETSEELPDAMAALTRILPLALSY